MQKKILFISICLVLSFNYINANKIQSRVIGGSKVNTIKGMEYLVAIMTKNKNSYSTSCGGALISPNYVVTAAHCIMDKDMYVFANNHILADTQQEPALNAGATAPKPVGDISLVSRVFYYSDFIENSNDIAVLKLETPINIDKYVSLPIKGQTASLISKNTKMTLSGWGLTSSGIPGNIGGAISGDPTQGKPQGDIPEGAVLGGSIDPSQIPAGAFPARDLYTIDISTLTQDQCEKDLIGKETTAPSASTIKRRKESIKRVICAGGAVVKEANKGACRGDSGGPLVYKNGNDTVLVGVVSSGSSSTCTGVKSSLYTKVEFFLDFIDEAKKGTFQSDGMLRKGFIEDLPKGWSLIGTEKAIKSDTKLLTSDIKSIYYYSSGSKKWKQFKVVNAKAPSDFLIPAKSGFWVYK